MNDNKKVTYVLNNTRFIFRPNFAGDPSKDKFGSATRKATIVIPDKALADEMTANGINVKVLEPRDATEEPVYFVTIIANFNSRVAPKMYLVSNGGEPVLLDEDTVGEIDNSYVTNVNASLNPWFNENTGKTSLYIRTMYVELEVEDDPFAGMYKGRAVAAGAEADDGDYLPFS
jgi:hypothetical protein